MPKKATWPRLSWPGVAEQQVEAHGGDDEDAGDDQHVQDVEVAQPQRDGEQEQQPGDGERAASPDPLLLREQPGRLDEQDDDDEQEAHAVAEARGDVAGAQLLHEGQDEAADGGAGDAAQARPG